MCQVSSLQDIWHFRDGAIPEKPRKGPSWIGLKEINISFVGPSIKQHETVEYFGCQLDSKLSEQAMASKVCYLKRWFSHILIMDIRHGFLF